MSLRMNLPWMLAMVGLAVGLMPSSTQAEEPTKLLRHVVLFKFKDDADTEKVAEIVKAFAALPSQIEEIHDFEYGTDNSPEGLADGFTHCFLVTFKDKAGLEAYLPHEAHQKFVALLKPQLDKVLVVDYWTQK